VVCLHVAPWNETNVSSQLHVLSTIDPVIPTHYKRQTSPKELIGAHRWELCCL